MGGDAMPRLTWNRSNEKDIRVAKEAFALYTRRHFIARHNGVVVTMFDASHQVLEFELGPSAFDRIMKETDPWES
jgi:hypothetical protein